MTGLNLEGRRFGRLTVVRRAQGNRHSNRRWFVRCDCGVEKITNGGSLIKGTSRSCGCLQKELASEKRRGKFGESSLRGLWLRYRSRARKIRVGFELTVEDVRLIVAKDCYYCGKAPAQMTRNTKRSHGHYVYNGLDRRDNQAGYTLDNVLPCCGDCNRAKLAMSHDDFIALAKRIAVRHQGC
jgi:hypothetical protein